MKRRMNAVLSTVVLASAGGCAAANITRRDVPVAPAASRPVLAEATPAAVPPNAIRPPMQAAHRPVGARRTATDLRILERQVAARMPRHDRALHRRLARVIHDESRKAGLDPLLVVALIHVESSFDPAAVSPAGAIGLMQLREPTLRQEVERSALPTADPHDPVANVRAGIRYLRRLVTAFGHTDVALMAYNAGPNRIGAYRRAGGIPERFHEYPRRIRGELDRLQLAAALQAN